MKDMPVMVSVCMISYNHQLYIEKAIDSVLDQVADFQVEVIVCNDHSTDKTIERLEKYRDRITIIQNEENLGPWRSLEKTFNRASGKYIALLEGDDYWTDAHKLQQQVDFLENHEKYAMCFTNYACVDENGQELDQLGFEYHGKRIIHQEDIFNLVCPPTRVVLFKSNLLPETFPDFHYDTVSGDAFIFSMVLKEQPAYFIDQKMAVWRIRNSSLYSSVSDFERRANIIRDFRKFLKYYTNEPQRSQLKKTIKKQHWLLLKQLISKPTLHKFRRSKSLILHA